MMCSVDIKTMVYISVDNNSCISCKSHEISAMWYIINLISCNMPIDDVESRTPYVYVFVWCYLYIPEELGKITV